MASKNKIAFNLIVSLALIALIGILIWQLSGLSSANTVKTRRLPSKSQSLSKETAAATVAIQIEPAVKAKGINRGSLDNIEVAVLSDANFDAKSIDPASLNFAGAPILKTKATSSAGEQNDLNAASSAASTFDIAFKDVNGDGREDLLAHFSIPYLSQLSEGFHEAVLTSTTVSGAAIRGSDYVNAYGESVLKNAGSKIAAPDAQFCNAAAITIPDSGAATPYPSSITVAGQTGVISNLTVSLLGFSHTFPSDVSVLLVGPTGQKMTLFSGSGAGNDVVNVNLTFDDAGTSYLTLNGTITTGTYKPTNNSGTNFLAPAPQATPASPYSATLSSFFNTNPNGTWNLYVVDSFGGDSGSFSGGWCLNITTAPSATVCAPTLLQGSIAAGDLTQVSRLFRDGFISECVGTAKTCPGSSGTSTLRYDTYTVTNQSGAASCVTVTTTSSCGVNVFTTAYLTSYTPPPPSTNLCINYLADAGTSPNNVSGAGPSFSFTFPAGATVVLVVNEVTANTPCAAYSLLIEGNLCAPVGTCTLTCPANITVSNDPNQCGAVVNYPAPTSTGTCGTITCSPASGSFFPKGTTTVTCTASVGPTCTFTVTVNDTQAPTITCPPNISAVQPTPGATCTVVTYCPPTVSDNCPGVTFACVPPSGSCLPPGTTTVTCTATDTSANQASCQFTVTVFNICLQDDSDPSKVLLFITSGAQTGQYRFCCNGTTFTGTGTVKQIGSTFTLTHNPPDRRVLATISIGGTGTASLQFPPGTTLCTIIDKATVGVHTCVCGTPVAGCN